MMEKLKLRIRSSSLCHLWCIRHVDIIWRTFTFVLVYWWRRCRTFVENLFVCSASAVYLSLRIRFKLKIPHLGEIFKLILFVVRQTNEVERSSFFAVSVCVCRCVTPRELFQNRKNDNLLAAGKTILLSLKVSHTFSYCLILEYFSRLLVLSFSSFIYICAWFSILSVGCLDNTAKMYIKVFDVLAL